VITLAVAFAAEQGSRDDPLVSQSYLAQLRSQLVNDVRDQLRDSTDGLLDELTARHADIERQINDQIAGILNNASEIDLRDPEFIDYVVGRVLDALDSPTGIIGDAAIMRRVDVPANRTVLGPIGMEVVLRQGSATAVAGTNPAMINLTTGEEIRNGAALEMNSLYLVTIPASGNPTNGFRSGSNGATVFIRGEFTISN